MKLNDAAKILNVSGDVSPEIVKKAYRRACAKFHPDRNPAGEEMMKAVNAAYEALKEHVGSVAKSENPEYEANYDDDLNDALNAIIDLEGLIIEICGAWVWVSGNTKEHKDALKAAGYWWAAKKKAWYFRPADWKSASRGGFSMDKIRDYHGSKIVRGTGPVKLEREAA